MTAFSTKNSEKQFIIIFFHWQTNFLPKYVRTYRRNNQDEAINSVCIQ